MATLSGEHFTTDEAAAYLGLSIHSIRQYLHHGVIESVKFGPARLVSRAECDRYIKEKRPRGNPNFKRQKKK